MILSRWRAFIQSTHPIIANPKNWFLLIFGFSSGLPLALTGTGATFQAWLTVNNVDLTAIGFLSFCGLPYVLKFLWAPLIDHFVPPFLGRRRGWMLITQLWLMLAILCMGFLAPEKYLMLVGMLGFGIAFLSATQDIAFDGYRVDLLTVSERGMGVSTAVFGYRMAMLVSGALSLVFADYFGWRLTFILLSLSFLPGLVSLWFAPEPRVDPVPKNFENMMLEPLRALFAREGFMLMLLLVVAYKLTDAFAEALMTPFLLKGAGFALNEIGYVNKILGLIATLFGVFLGGLLMARMTLFRALLLFGFCQGLANFAFFALAIVGKHYGLFVVAVLLEKITSGMGTTAFMAFLMSLCDKQYSATQYALLSAAAALGRTVVGPIAGVFVSTFGWVLYYFFAVMAAIPSIVLILLLKDRLLAHEQLEKARQEAEKLAEATQAAP